MQRRNGLVYVRDLDHAKIKGHFQSAWLVFEQFNSQTEMRWFTNFKK